MRGVEVFLALVVLATMSGVGCGSWRGPRGFAAVRFEGVPPVSGATFPNWPLPPHEAALFLSTADLQVVRVEGAGAGLGGGKGVDWIMEGHEEIDIEIRPVPDDLDGLDNAPRKELAAYMVQQLFLDPEDYVVPTSVIRCPSLEGRAKHPAGTGDLPGRDTRCELVTASLRLRDVTVPDVLYDKERFLTDATYARYLADFNLFTYLVDHSDGRSGNFLVSRDDARRQVFAIDNGITSDPFWNNHFVPNWNIIRVAALRRQSVERLRQLEKKDLDVLLVVWQMENDGTGGMPVVKPGPPIDPEEGASMRDGVVQFGLTGDEVEEVWERIEDLLEDVDGGKIPLF